MKSVETPNVVKMADKLLVFFASCFKAAYRTHLDEVKV